MEQNIIIDTEEGKVKIQFDKCFDCKHYDFCYKSNGVYHQSTPNGLSEDCLNT